MDSLVPGGIDDMPAQLVALRDARQRAAEARSAAERALREAQAAEAEVAAQEEQAIVVAAAARRERWAEKARVAATSEREAVETLSALQLQIQRVASMKAQTEAAVAAIRASLSEHEERLLAAEDDERSIRADIAITEHHAQECTHARNQADAALHALA
jgi:chromosome segregation ATPase